jgi:hypothetical protein
MLLRETFVFMTSSYPSGARHRYCACVGFFVATCEASLGPSFEIEWSGTDAARSMQNLFLRHRRSW